ncbi:Hint domain-containing protein [Acidisoma cellulosilytica]|uniref:Hint domain-containing protein n=1 Tax=Acidisoma cellulosilyticum TaxID=2802395 RepID=A0A964E5H5_9PROT|nr:Hint domain-containing protein [Acidisoma cellulosilyticum]MCB8882675.1 Hint domain-containing protein [Acidisoma cellulosilyticum]
MPSLESDETFNYDDEVTQKVTVTTTGIYRITGVGAHGGASSENGNQGGEGAEIVGDFTLNAGDVLDITVGGSGADGYLAGGGGGATEVFDATTGAILLIAGAGGGAGQVGAGGNANLAPGGHAGGGGINAGRGGSGSKPGASGGGGGGGDGGGGGGAGFFTYGGGGGGSYISPTATKTEAVLDSRGNGVVVIDSVQCFLEGTHIATPSGERCVETLQIGDLVTTSEGAEQPILWIGHRTLHAHGREGQAGYLLADPLKIYPIRVMAGALGDNLPARDLFVSPDHALLIDGILIQAGALANGATIRRLINLPETFTYYHVELADHGLILAEGVPAETFVDNVDRMGFDNWHEHEALYPNVEPIREMDIPRAQSRRQVPKHILNRLHQRAATLFHSTAAAA